MKKFLYDNRGATAIEYCLICALMVLACVAAFSLLGGGSNGMWSKVQSNVTAKL